MRLKDWYDFLDDAAKRVVAEEYAAGPKRLVPISCFFGDGVNVICAGDQGHADREAQRLWFSKFHRQPCHTDKFGAGFQPPLTVAERLARDGLA